jgi:AraC family transcriptional regulator, transcriptional activator of pobA
VKHFKSIQNLSEFYNIDLRHPLIDIQKYEDTKSNNLIKNEPIRFDFYIISFVKNFNGFIQIGNTKFEGENGVLHFIEPQQKYTCNSTNPWKGYQVLIHPDIFKEYFSYKDINMYDFFSYEVNETLLLVEEEEKLVSDLLEMAWNEFHNKKDTFSMPIILSYISTLLNLTERFYARQFETRKTLFNQLSSDFFDLLKSYYSQNKEVETQQPTVQFFAQKLNVTPNYLSDTIKHHSGKPALTIIHDFVIEEAKKQLTTSNQTVSEISYQLGFEYPNYFSRLFKQKTSFSPTEYRKSVKSI